MLITKVLMVIIFASGEVWQEPVDEQQCAHLQKMHADAPWMYGGNAQISGKIESVQCRSLVSYRDLTDIKRGSE